MIDNAAHEAAGILGFAFASDEARQTAEAKKDQIIKELLRVCRLSRVLLLEHNAASEVTLDDIGEVIARAEARK